MPQTQLEPKDNPQDNPLGNEGLKKILESLLFITDRALSLKELCKLCGLPAAQAERVAALVAEIKKDLEEKASPVQVVEVAEGFQMGTRKEYAPFVRKLFEGRLTMKLSTAAHETLSIVAYKQPLTRAEIEEIRGVEVIAALETLLEKRLVKVVGRKESVGRPLMYGTTLEFLRHFGLKNLEELPPLDSFKAAEPASAAEAYPESVAQAEGPEPAADEHPPGGQ